MLLIIFLKWYYHCLHELGMNLWMNVVIPCNFLILQLISHCEHNESVFNNTNHKKLINSLLYITSIKVLYFQKEIFD